MLMQALLWNYPVGTVGTEADAVLEDLAAESTVDMGVLGFRVADGATLASSVTTTSGASKLFTCKTGSIIRHDSVWQAKSCKGSTQLANGLAGSSS